MSLSLKLELKADKKVLVTNSQTNEQKEVTVSFLQEATGDSLLMPMQYKYYELFINAEKAWNRIKYFNAEREVIKQIYIEQKFRDIMVNDRWLEITDYEREMYNKALAWINTYTPKSNIDKTAIVAAGSGAVTGALASNAIGGIGIAAGGNAFGIGMLGLATLGTVTGLAAYGISKAFD
jgi:hypothetical protein